MVTKYGLISDIHSHPQLIVPALRTLKEEGIDALLVNGDIGDNLETTRASQEFIGYILEHIGRSGLEAYVQPGSHEKLGVFEPVMAAMSASYANLINTMHSPKMEKGTHHLVFIPGSDWNAGGEYTFGNSSFVRTGTYISTTEGLVPYQDAVQLSELHDQEMVKGFLRYQNIQDLWRQVTEPDKTISVCHVPRLFDNVMTGVDMAYFAEGQDGSVMPGVYLERKIRERAGNIPLRQVEKIAENMGLYFNRENRGSRELGKLYDELGITKAVSGHFHESGHRAHDGQAVPIAQGEQVKELYWNSGHLDAGQTGILHVGDGKVSYQNILLK